jgi:hypothetical protein
VEAAQVAVIAWIIEPGPRGLRKTFRSNSEIVKSVNISLGVKKMRFLGTVSLGLSGGHITKSTKKNDAMACGNLHSRNV